jgi:hypothetical protein
LWVPLRKSSGHGAGRRTHLNLDVVLRILCEEKARLVRKYNVATAKFSETVKELHRRMGASPKQEYARLMQISNEARVQSEQARLALEKHIAAHGSNRPLQPH